MQQIVRILTIPVDFWHGPRLMVKQWRTRRAWPTRDDIDAMDDETLNQYLASVGIDSRVEPHARESD